MTELKFDLSYGYNILMMENYFLLHIVNSVIFIDYCYLLVI